MKGFAVVVAAPALGLTACDGEDPVESALRDASAANHARALKTDDVQTPASPESLGTVVEHDWEGRPTEGDAAFRASERAMHARMMGASGATVDEAYIAKMIEHHRGAVAMAEVALDRSRDPEIRLMAQAVIDAQTREIAEMQAWKAAPAS